MRLAALLFFLVGAFGGCAQMYKRREIRDLAPDEIARFVSAIRMLQARSAGNPSKYDVTVNIHWVNMNIAHGNPNFFPWHRKYILEFEKEMQKIDPNITLPYWDWTLDSQAPERSPVFSIFGGNGDAITHCVKDGPFANSTDFYPSKSCFSRNFNGGNLIGAFVSPEVLARLISDASVYDNFRSLIEGNPHSSVHNNIGGDMATMGSPNDPIFWVHHAFIDKIWTEYQAKGPEFANRFDSDSGELDAKMKLAPWNIAISDLMNATKLCYSYEPAGLTVGSSAPQVSFIALDQPSTPELVSPIAFDRTNLYKIRTVDPLPEEYIQMMNYDSEGIRGDESAINNLTDTFNKDPQFVSISALVHAKKK